jgi:hypothetical protein
MLNELLGPYSVQKQLILRLILIEFFVQLAEEEQSYVWISHGLWPAQSPDLTPCDIYLWGNLKDKVYRMNPHMEKELKGEHTVARPRQWLLIM